MNNFNLSTSMKSLCLAAVCLLSIAAHANNYYFSVQQGDDNRTSAQAQNKATPWKSLAKLNSYFSSLQPGDSVLFNRGETFYGTLFVARSGNPGQPIVIGAYGTGKKPVLSGFTEMLNWTSIGGNKWTSTNAALTDSVNAFTLNNTAFASGRYPNPGTANGGWLTYESHSGNTSITDNQLSNTPNWTGAEVVIRKNRYILNNGRISNHSGNTITYTDNSGGYEATDNYGYFIQNNPATLDIRGEWAYDRINKLITLYLGNGENPNNEIVKAAAIKTVIEIQTQSNLTFTDLAIDGSNENGFDIYQGSNIQLLRCSISNTGLYAIRGGSNNAVLIDNCTINNSYNDGIYFENESGDIVRNSSIKNTGTFAGMGQNGENTYLAVNINGDNTSILNNVIDSSGYNALRFQGNNVTVNNNLVSNFNFIKDDGGGIYTWTGTPALVYTGRKITGNIVLNGIGAGKGTPDSTSVATNGIYVDETAGYLDILNNTVANCRTGIFLHNGNHINLSGNTSYNNVTQLLFHEDHTYSIRNNAITNNILFAKQGWQEVSELLSDADDFNLFGTFDNNYYCRPLNDKYHITTSYQTPDTFFYKLYDLPQWRAQYGFDINSKITGTQIQPYTVVSLNGANKFSNATFTSNISGATTWSPTAVAHINWANNEKLDGGAIKETFDLFGGTDVDAQPAYVILGVGSVDASKQYILRFSLQGTIDLQSLKVYIRKEGDPYNQLVTPQYCNLSSTRTENEFLLSFPETQGNASVILEATRKVGIFYVDNVKFYEATITNTNPDDHIRFEYNASNNTRNVDLGGNQYVDAANNFYSGTLALQPWTSRVLIVTTLAALPVKYGAFTGKLINKTAKLDWTTTAPPEGSYFEVERSLNQSFSKIGTVPSVQNNSSGTYSFTDQSPAPGKNYYRIKEIDKDGTFTYSSVVVVNNTEAAPLTIWPNPATASVFITLPRTMIGRNVVVNLQNASGVTLLRKTVTAAGENIQLDVQSLPAGIYFTRLEAGGQLINASFMKQ